MLYPLLSIYFSVQNDLKYSCLGRVKSAAVRQGGTNHGLEMCFQPPNSCYTDITQEVSHEGK
jgi:hypothetical protein